MCTIIVPEESAKQLLKSSGDNHVFVKPKRSKEALHADAVVWLPGGTTLDAAREIAAKQLGTLGVVDSKRGYGIRCLLEQQERISADLGISSPTRSTPWWTITHIPPPVTTTGVLAALAKQGWKPEVVKEIHGFKTKTLIVACPTQPPIKMLKIRNAGEDHYARLGPTRSRQDRETARANTRRAHQWWQAGQPNWRADPQHQWYQTPGDGDNFLGEFNRSRKAQWTNQGQNPHDAGSRATSRSQSRASFRSGATSRTRTSAWFEKHDGRDQCPNNEKTTTNDQLATLILNMNNAFNSNFAALQNNQEALTTRIAQLEKSKC